MWKINYPVLRMMLADAPHYETARTDADSGKDETKKKKQRRKKGKDAVSFFQSMLKNDKAEE